MGEKYRLKEKDLKCIAKVYEILSQEEELKITTANLAKKAGIPRNKLQYGFQEVYGCTIRSFRQQQLMERAKKLLSTTEESLGIIAIMIGYTTNSAFTTAFKNKNGITPVEFRKMARKRVKA